MRSDWTIQLLKTSTANYYFTLKAVKLILIFSDGYLIPRKQKNIQPPRITEVQNDEGDAIRNHEDSSIEMTEAQNENSNPPGGESIASAAAAEYNDVPQLAKTSRKKPPRNADGIKKKMDSRQTGNADDLVNYYQNGDPNLLISVDGNSDPLRRNNFDDVPDYQYDDTIIPISTSTELDENQEEQPDWSLNYHADVNQGQSQRISTRDLISWSFQIARGMDHLVKKKVLHGDLAARNILLADDGVVKVADFGLARQLYQDYDYKKQGKVSSNWSNLISTAIFSPIQ